MAVTVALGATLLALKPLLRTKAPPAGTVALVRADMSGFWPQAIRTKVGQPFTVRLKSLDTRFHTDGGGRHEFAIDELGVKVIAPPLGTAEATFIPQRTGVYRFYCSVCCGGKANPTMWGDLIVTS